jgi:transposase
MPKTYSSDLRERLIAAVTSGMSRNEAAEVFGVAISTAVKWMQRLRDQAVGRRNRVAGARRRWSSTRTRYWWSLRSGQMRL